MLGNIVTRMSYFMQYRFHIFIRKVLVIAPLKILYYYPYEANYFILHFLLKGFPVAWHALRDPWTSFSSVCDDRSMGF